jgi:hypothetical protein
MRTNDNGTERDMTEAEEKEHLAAAKIALAEAKAAKEADAAKAAARRAVLDKLGLTADEASALLG